MISYISSSVDYHETYHEDFFCISFSLAFSLLELSHEQNCKETLFNSSLFRYLFLISLPFTVNLNPLSLFAPFDLSLTINLFPGVSTFLSLGLVGSLKNYDEKLVYVKLRNCESDLGPNNPHHILLCITRIRVLCSYKPTCKELFCQNILFLPS